MEHLWTEGRRHAPLLAAIALLLAVFASLAPGAALAISNAQGQTAALVASSNATASLSDLTGSGTSTNPYQLSSADDYDTLHSIVNEGESDCAGLYFKQEADVTLSSSWTPIGCRIDENDASIQGGNNMRPFRGTLDGGNFTLNVPAGRGPLFGYVRGATIKNLKVYGERIAGYGLINNMEGIGLNNDASAVVIDNVTLKSGTSTLKSGFLGGNITTSTYSATAANYVSTIRNCTIESGVVIGYGFDQNPQSMIGSFAGRFNGTIENCTSAATVKGANYVGGIVGCRDNAMGTCTVSRCTFTGSVVGSGERVGGIAGGNYVNQTAPNGKKISIDNCIVSGAVSGADKVGGILGADEFGAQAWSDCSFTGNSVSGTVEATEGFDLGGIVGFYANLNKHDMFFNNCFKDDCGASSAFGRVCSVDTSCATYAGTASTPYGAHAATGSYYYNSAGASTDYLELVDSQVQSLLKFSSSPYAAVKNADENRVDDPLGVDAAKLAYSNDTGTLEDACISLSIAGNYKTDYKIGDAFSTSGMTVTGTWTDGTEQTIDLADCSFSGYNANKAGYQTIIVTYGRGIATYAVLVTNGASRNYNANLGGTLYLSVSDDARFVTSDGAVKGTTMWYVPIKLSDVAAFANSNAYKALGLDKYAYPTSVANASYRYELTAMQLFAFVNERYSSKGANALVFTGNAGSSFMKDGFFGHDGNLNYYVNGSFPTRDGGTIGASCDQVTLKGGMFVDVAMFTDHSFYADPSAGFHYFVNAANAPIHACNALEGSGTTVRFGRVYDSTGGAIVPQGGYTLYWGTAANWGRYATSTTAYSGKVTTNSSGQATITFPAAGTYYVWADGSKGSNLTRSVVSSPACMKVTVKAKAANPIQASPKAASSIPHVTYGKDTTIAASKVFTVTNAKGSLTYAKSSGSASINVAKNGTVTVKGNLAVGTYPVKVAISAAGDSSYKPATVTVIATITVIKAANPMKVTSAVKSISANKVMRKSRTLVPLKVTGAQGGKAFKVTKWKTKRAKSYLKVNAKTGKVMVKKGTPKGTYKFRVRVIAKGTKNYEARTVTKNVTIKVK